MKTFELPAVAGRSLLCSHAAFERACLVKLWQEQEKLLPDNSLINVLCNAVRLSREHCDAMTAPTGPLQDDRAQLETARDLLSRCPGIRTDETREYWDEVQAFLGKEEK